MIRNQRYFTFNGESSKDQDLIVTRIQRPILPDLRERKLIIPGRDGAWDFGNNTYEEISISVECILIKPLDKRLLIRALAGWLSVKSNLIFSDEPEKYYVGRIYGAFTEDIDGVIGSFTLTFICEPFAYAAYDAYNDPIQYDEGYLYDDGNFYPNEEGFTWLYNTHGSGLYNNGIIKTPLEITIAGTVEGIKITHVETGAYLDIDVTLSGDTVIINTENFTITKNGTSILGDLQSDSEFFKLQPGENSLTFEGLNPNCSITYNWEQKYL